VCERDVAGAVRAAAPPGAAPAVRDSRVRSACGGHSFPAAASLLLESFGVAAGAVPAAALPVTASLVLRVAAGGVRAAALPVAASLVLEELGVAAGAVVAEAIPVAANVVEL
jgi:hypothetical protein